jgi:hypothetical protein
MEDSSSENHLLIDVIRWYNYYCDCVLHENLLPRSHFLININPQQKWDIFDEDIYNMDESETGIRMK